jgi:hypothetical protein
VSAAVALPAPGPENDWRTGEYWSLCNTSCWWDTSVLEQVLIPIHFTEAFRQ